MKALIALALLAFAMGVAAQTSSPDPKQASAQDTPPKPRPALKLNLDEVDLPARPTVTFGAKDAKKDAKKDEAASALPGLGGPRTNSWERPPSEVFPKESGPDSKLPY